MAYVRLCRDIFPPRRHWRRLLWSTAALLASAVGVLTLLAARYQPLQPGGSGGGSFPGMRTAVGMHWVSKYISNAIRRAVRAPATRAVRARRVGCQSRLI